MLSLQLFTHPRIKIPSKYKQNTLSSVAHYNAKNRKYGPNKFSPNSSPFKFHLTAAVTNDSDAEKSSIYAIQLPEGLEAELMPNHIAVMMDGHRRWAAHRNLPVVSAHRAEIKTIQQLVISCSKLGIKALTLFAMSTENYKRRSHEEIDSLVTIPGEMATEIHDLLMGHDIKVSVIGDTPSLPGSMHSMISTVEAITKANKGMHLVVAVNYGGRYDIIQASKKISRKVRDGVLGVEDVNEAIFEQHLETGGFDFPNPDLIIRSSGELRISNFLLWQAAYSELLFVRKLFPDFVEADLIEALKEFQQRKRRYGG